jgi:hypothetical protein
MSSCTGDSSAFNTSKQVRDGMSGRKGRRIINVASVNLQKGAFGQTNYAAAFVTGANISINGGQHMY